MKFRVFCIVLVLAFSSFSAWAAEGAGEPLKDLFESYKKQGGSGSAEEASALSPEEAVIQRVKRELALLPASIQITPESIKADPAGRTITCENVSITTPETPGLTVTIGKILLSGVDADSFAGSPGDMTEADSLSFHNIRLSQEGAFKVTLDAYTIEGLSFAYRDALKALQESKNGKTAMPSYLGGYKAKQVRASGFKADDGTIRLSIDSLTSKDLKFSACGPISLRNVHVDIQEQRIFSLEEFSLAEMALPEMFKQMLLNPDSAGADSLMMALMGKPFSVLDKLVVKELSLSNMKLNIPQTMPVALEKFVCDLRVENTAASLTGDLRKLSLALSQLPKESPFSLFSEAAGGQDLLLNANVSLTADSNRKITLKSSLEEKQKGDLSLGAVLTLTQDFEGLLHEAEFKTNDNGIVDLLLGAVATISEVEGGYAQFLKAAVEGVQQSKSAFTEQSMIDGIDMLARLIQNGGSFQFKSQPSTPVNLDRLGDMLGNNPSALGYSFGYSAPTTPKKRP